MSSFLNVITSATDPLVAWFLSDGFFILFWVLTFLAFLVRSPWVCRAYLVFFFGAMFAVGLIGTPLVAWPFHHWHLWARILPDDFEFYEVGVKDGTGNFFLYDCRAARPLIPEILRRRFAYQILSGKQGEQIAESLLNMANTYQPQNPVVSWTEFPARTPGAFWPADHEKFVSLVVRKKRVQLGRSLKGSSLTVLAEKEFR
jgi:hypothetical protein